MKKIFSIMASVALAAVALTGCDDNTDPKAQVPQSNDFLNTPPTANYTYNLTETPTVTLTCSQPDFGGVATIPSFAVQLSLDPKFASVPAEWKFDDPASTPLNFVELPSSYNTYTIDIPARDLADAINACRGYNDLQQLKGEAYKDYNGPVYLRLRAYFPSATDTQNDLYSVISNVIALSKVIAYPTLRQPGYIYLVGAPEGWAGPTPGNAAHYEDWKLFEADNAIDSKIYSATFDIPAGQFQFRFYSELQDWDFNSIGSQNDDNPVDITMKDGVYSGPCVIGQAKGEGKGSWQIPGWEGGQVTITVNLNAKTVEFKKVN